MGTGTTPARMAPRKQRTKSSLAGRTSATRSPFFRPRAGSALDKVSEVEAALCRYDLAHEIVLTRCAGHAQELARAATGDGVDVIAVVGGDGTLNEVAQAYLDEHGAPCGGPDLALVPCG